MKCENARRAARAQVLKYALLNLLFWPSAFHRRPRFRQSGMSRPSSILANLAFMVSVLVIDFLKKNPRQSGDLFRAAERVRACAVYEPALRAVRSRL
jgi:hypothetical protein